MIKNKSICNEKNRQNIKDLSSVYVKRLLMDEGLYADAIKKYPILIDLKKIEVATKRLLKNKNT